MDEEVQDGVLDADDTADVEPTTTDDAPGIAEQTVDEDVVSDDDDEVDDLDADGIPTDLPEDPQKQKEAFTKMRLALKKARRGNTQPAADEDADDQVDASQDFDFRIPAPINYTDQDLQDPVTAARIQAADAQRQAAMTQAQLEDMEAESRFPQLAKRSGQYDPVFAKMVKRSYTHEVVQAMHTNRPKPRLAQVAAMVAKDLKISQVRTEKSTLVKAQQQLAAKEQAALDARGSSVNYEPPAEQNKARIQKIRSGSRQALADELLDIEVSKYSNQDLGFYGYD